jgi:ribosomal protein L34E
MPFLMNCNNKGCGKYQQPALDLKSNEVICTECGKIIAGVSHFTKTQMKSLGQTVKPPKPAYSVRCEKCKQESLPKLENNKLVCAGCNVELKNISRPFEILIRNAIKKGEEEL